MKQKIKDEILSCAIEIESIDLIDMCIAHGAKLSESQYFMVSPKIYNHLEKSGIITKNISVFNEFELVNLISQGIMADIDKEMLSSLIKCIKK